MKRVKNQWSIGLWAMMILSGDMVARAMDETRLIVSADSLNTENPYQAFYSSLIFSGAESPIIIEQPQQVFESQDACIFPMKLLMLMKSFWLKKLLVKLMYQELSGPVFLVFP